MARRLDELGQHLAAEEARVLDLAVELAIGERAGAAFAELDVGFGIEHASAPEAPGVFRSLAHDLAALQQDRGEAHLGEDQGGEQAAWAGADDDWAKGGALRCVAEVAVGHVRRRADVLVGLETGEDGGLVAHVEVEGVDELDRRALACVPAAAEQV